MVTRYRYNENMKYCVAGWRWTIASKMAVLVLLARPILSNSVAWQFKNSLWRITVTTVQNTKWRTMTTA